MKSSRLKVALIQQYNHGLPAENMIATQKSIREAAKQGAQLILLQELFLNCYFCQTEESSHFDLAEPIPGPSSEQLGSVAAELGVVIVVSLFERRAAGLYHNTAIVLERDGQIAGIYRKMHIPDDPGFYEKFYFTPGDLGFTPIETSVGCLGILVCWDQWFPEAARLMALAGAEILLYPTAIGWDPNDGKKEQQRQRDAWITIQRSHAIANTVPLLACNRAGYEIDPSGATAGIHFWGSSFVAGPQGELLAEAPIEGNSLLITEIDKSRSETLRQTWPFLRDRRIDAYNGLSSLYLDDI